jgi:hypothetical protein
LPVVPRRVRAARAKVLSDRAIRDALAAIVHESSRSGERHTVSLAQVRTAVGLTQTDIGKTLRMTQAEVSKLERRTNPQLATLTRFIRATGGEPRICAVYGDLEVPLAVGDLQTPSTPSKRTPPTNHHRQRAPK